MPKSVCFKIVALALLMGLLGVTLLAAQSETTATPTAEATPEPVTLSCDLMALQEQQAELEASLRNFSREAGTNAGVALDNLFKVGASYQQLALDCGYIPADAASRAVGTDVQQILNTLSKVTGDPINGQLLYNGNFACASCHETEGGIVAPHTESTFTRIEETRLKDPALAGYTPEQYIVESIVQPTHYTVPNYNPVMPTDFGSRVTLQDLADLVSFLESQDGPLPVVLPAQTEFTGQLTSSSSFAQHSFAGGAGDIIIVRLTSTAFDTYLSLDSADGQEMTNNDDFAGTTNSRLGPVLLPAAGTYTLRVDSYNRQQTGNYTLILEVIKDCGTVPVAIVSSLTDPINLRGGPGTDYPRVGSAQNGECLQVIGRSANALWLKIQAVGGRTGWLASNLVESVGDLTGLPTLTN